MTYPYTPHWDKPEAKATVERCKGRRWRRPNGRVIYEVMEVALLPHCGWGIRIRNTAVEKGYIVCSNMINEEGWVEA